MKSRAFGLAMAGLATVLVLALAGTTVLASQPGDVSYPLRVVAERAPAALQPSPAGRANAELRIADRRLDDLESHLRATRQVEAAALAALVRGDEAAARRAIDLPETQRRLVAQRIERHAAAILRLVDRAETPAIETRLQQVASHMKLVAARLRLGKPPAEQRNQTGSIPLATVSATEKSAWTATATPTATRTPIQATPLGQASVPVIAATTPTPTAWPEAPQGTSEPPTAQPDAPAATSTATSQPGRTDTATPTQVIPSTPTPIVTAEATTVVRPSRTPRPPITPQASRTPRPPITPRPTRTPRPPITPRPTRTPRPPLTPRPQPTIQPTEFTEPTPTQTGVTATPTASGPQPTLMPTPTPTEGSLPAESPTPVATPTVDPGSGGSTPLPTSMPPPRPTRPRRG